MVNRKKNEEGIFKMITVLVSVTGHVAVAGMYKYLPPVSILPFALSKHFRGPHSLSSEVTQTFIP